MYETDFYLLVFFSSRLTGRSLLGFLYTSVYFQIFILVISFYLCLAFLYYSLSLDGFSFSLSFSFPFCRDDFSFSLSFSRDCFLFSTFSLLLIAYFSILFLPQAGRFLSGLACYICLLLPLLGDLVACSWGIYSFFSSFFFPLPSLDFLMPLLTIWLNSWEMLNQLVSSLPMGQFSLLSSFCYLVCILSYFASSSESQNIFKICWSLFLLGFEEGSVCSCCYWCSIRQNLHLTSPIQMTICWSMATSLRLERTLLSLLLILMPLVLEQSAMVIWCWVTLSLAWREEMDLSLMTILAFFLFLPMVFSPRKKGNLGISCARFYGSRITIQPAITFYSAILLLQPQNQLTTNSLLSNPNPQIYNILMSQIDKQIEQLRRGEIINESEVKHLCSKAREILVEEGNVQRVDSPVTICGDIHGQFYDLLQLFKNGGDIPRVCYLFLGDFVDRGFNSVQTFLLLLAYKVRYPDLVTLIRGNHECRQITQVYGFYDECLRKYGSLNVWRYCTDVFDYLSLAAIIDDSIFCVHGGLSPSINNSIDEIRSIDRKQEIPHDGSMCDLMWSDPDDITGWVLSPRGAGYLFGGNVVESFNHSNNVTEIVRAHQLIMEGYKEMFNKQLVTVWSAPNYCYRCNNIASILVLDEKLGQKFIKFEAATHESRTIPAKKAIPEYFL